MILLAFIYNPLSTLVLGIVFIILNILDAHSTWCVLRPYHYHRERNPVARWIFRKLGLIRGIFAFKAILILGLSAATGFYTAYDPLTINIVLIVANLVFSWVVWHNYNIHRKIRKAF